MKEEPKRTFTNLGKIIERLRCRKKKRRLGRNQQDDISRQEQNQKGVNRGKK